MRTSLGVLLIAASSSVVARLPTAHVPFVGCPSDGQLGPQPAPAKGKTPRVESKAAAKLAFYSSGELGVLAPRGWRCIGLSGSNGGFLLVTPERHNAQEFFQADPPNIRGAAVQISYSMGGTSGRLSVLRAIVRYFPHYRSFVDEIREAELDFDALNARRYTGDVIIKHTLNYLRFKTPAGKEGEGTNSRLLPGARPIEGYRRIIGPASEPDLIGVDVRLPPGQGWLVEAILTDSPKGGS